MIWRVILFWLLGVSLAFADLPRPSRVLADSFQYDGANRLTNTISPLSHSSSQVFNNRGLLQSCQFGIGIMARQFLSVSAWQKYGVGRKMGLLIFYISAPPFFCHFP